MTSLLNSGLCTKDIYSFVCGQADLCVTLDIPDWTTTRSAMSNKIRDLTRTLKNDYKLKSDLEKELLQKLNADSPTPEPGKVPSRSVQPLISTFMSDKSKDSVESQSHRKHSL